MDNVAQAIVNGVLLGGLYALAAAGLNLIFGVMRVINVAHGEFLMAGAYVSYFLWDGLTLNPLLALPAVMVATFLLGQVVYRLAVRRVVEAPLLMSLLITFGLSIMMVNLGLYFFEGVFRSVPVFQGSFSAAGLFVSESRGIAFGAAIVITAAVWWFLRKSTMGKAVRATAQHAELAEACGIDVGRVRQFTFGLGTSLAGAAGGLIIFILSVSPSIGQTFILKAFAIVVIGGLGSLVGALAGGLILGVVDGITTLAADSQVAALVTYLLLILVLLVRPQGLLGIKEA